MVMNVSEMEAKVQEATNDEAWCVFPLIPIHEITRLTTSIRGASSTLMQEIAAGCVSFQFCLVTEHHEADRVHSELSTCELNPLFMPILQSLKSY